MDLANVCTTYSYVRRQIDKRPDLAVDGEVVILSVERGTYYGLDEIGTEILQRLESPVRIDALCEHLAAKYAADRQTIERDVLALFESLLAEGLVTVTP